jgi:O-antigen/teichoic acid export membrane protein
MKDLFVSFIATGAIQLSNLASGILAARLLGPEGRGELAVVILWPSLIAALGALGIYESVIYHSATRSEPPARTFASTMALGSSLSLVLMAAGLVLLPFAYADYRPEVRDIAYFYLLIIPVGYFALHMSGMFQGGLKLGVWNLLRTLIHVNYVVFILLFFFADYVSVRGFAAASLLANLCVVIVAIGFLNREGWIGWRPRLKTIKSLLRYGLKVHPAAALAIAGERLDQVLIAIWLAAVDLGLYVVALAVAGAASLLGSTISHIAFPKIANQPSDGGKAEVLGRYMRLTVAVTPVAAAALFVLAPWLVRLLFGDAFLPSVPVVQVLVLGALPIVCKFIFRAGFLAYDQGLLVSKVSLFGLVVSAVALILLLPVYGIVGAAWAVVIAQWSSFAMMANLARRNLGMNLLDLFRPRAADWRLAAASLKVWRT